MSPAIYKHGEGRNTQALKLLPFLPLSTTFLSFPVLYIPLVVWCTKLKETKDGHKHTNTQTSYSNIMLIW